MCLATDMRSDLSSLFGCSVYLLEISLVQGATLLSLQGQKGIAAVSPVAGRYGYNSQQLADYI